MFSEQLRKVEKIKPFGHSRARKKTKKMPHFDHFPRPGEIDPCGRHGLCNNVAKKKVSMHRNRNILCTHRIFLFLCIERIHPVEGLRPRQVKCQYQNGRHVSFFV